jgi:hypothetical protein
LSEDNASIQLYAIWEINSYTVQFDANGGTGTMSNQTFTYNEEKQLLKNQFTREDYIYIGWNTKADGTGTSYQDMASVRNLSSLSNGQVILYAQWKLDLPYEITHYSVDYTNYYIDQVEANTSLNTYRNYFHLEEGYSLQIDLGNKNHIFTGSVVKIYEGDTLKGSYTNIVRGDINGDGDISALDYIKVRNHIMDKNVITGGVYQKAADANKDGKINALDYVRIRNIIME